MTLEADFAEWLIEVEREYRPGRKRVPLREVSPHDPRNPARLEGKLMRGGDRMRQHGYAPLYARALIKRFGLTAVGPIREKLTIVELGILRGHGLALLCDVFPEARVIGLDVDITHFQDHRDRLLELGAFQDNHPHVYKFDEMAKGRQGELKMILNGDQIDIFIDDAIHRARVMVEMYNAARPLLAAGCLYFMEDNAAVHQRLVTSPKVLHEGELTVIDHG